MTKTEILKWFCSRKVMGEMCDTCQSYRFETYKGLSARLDKLIQSAPCQDRAINAYAQRIYEWKKEALK